MKQRMVILRAGLRAGIFVQLEGKDLGQHLHPGRL